MGVKETMKDTARVLGRMYDGIEYRGFGQAIVEELAAHAGVPVWNGLTDEFHPTQVIADFQTMEEHCNKKLSGMKLTYMGDGGNNVAASLMVGSAIMGVDFSIGAPPSCQPDPKLLEKCREIAAAHETPSRIALSTDPQEAVHGADFIYTDVWVSMGEPESRWKERIELLRPYQVNVDLMVAAKNSACKFLHCLPAFHNRDTKVGEEIFQKFGLEAMEVTEDVFESVASVVFDQAENRLHSIKAVMVSTLAG